MTITSTILYSLGLGLSVAASAHAAAELTVVPEAHDVPWVRPGDDAWSAGRPLFKVYHPSNKSDESAWGWVAVTDERILLKVIVHDPTHANHSTGYDIYNGDGLQVAIDARGDGTGTLPPETAMCGPDDGTFSFALTDTGPQAWAHHLRKNYNYGAGNREGGMPQLAPRITRDDAKQQTTYEIAIPWSEFDTPAGLSPVLGMAIHVNSGSDDKRVEYGWGQGAGGLPHPGWFHKLRIGRPPEPVVAARIIKNEIWSDQDRAVALVSVWSGEPQTVQVECGSLRQQFAIPSSDSQGHRQFSLGVPAQRDAQEVTLRIEHDGAVVASDRRAIQHQQQGYEALRGRIAELKARSNHPRVVQSWDALDQALQDAWRRSVEQLKTTDLPARDTLAWVQKLQQWLTDDMAQWENYTARKHQLYVACPSRVDGAVNLYKVRLPRNWKEGNAYPMLFSLHGAGMQNVLYQAAIDLEPETLAQQTSEYASGPDQCYEVKPYVGRAGYWETGETYCWEQIDDAIARFAPDPDRLILSGSSMGGFGTWQLGLRTPDRWSALWIEMGGGRDADPEIGLGRNVSYLPVVIAHGLKDTLVPPSFAYAMRDELARWGNTPQTHWFEEIGHGPFPVAYRRDVLGKLLECRRQRPAKFSFVSDADEHRGAWGITMERPQPATRPVSSKTGKPLPITCTLDCSVEGNAVTINSTDTPALAVDTGPGGLGLSGNVTIIWNGRQAYAGPSGMVRLQQQASGRTRGGDQ